MSCFRWRNLLIFSVACFLSVPASRGDSEVSSETTSENAPADDTAEMFWVFALREVVERQERTHPKTGETSIRRLYESVSPEPLYPELEFILDGADIFVLAAPDFAPDVEGRFQEGFLKHDLPSKQDRKMALQAARETHASLMGYGLVEVWMAEKAPESDHFSVTVKMSAKVYDLQERLARVVALLPPTKFRGLGTDRAKARDRALLNALEGASDKLLQHLKRKGIP